MPSLERFERLIETTVYLKPIELRHIGNQGEQTANWLAALGRLPKEEQLNQLKTVLSELIISNIDDKIRYTILEQIHTFCERFITQLQNDYIRNPQNTKNQQETSIYEVRSLYFLQILCYQGVAYREYEQLASTSPQSQPTQTHSSGWLSSLTKKFSSAQTPITTPSLSPQKQILTLAVYYLMSLYFKLMYEFALTYQKIPAILWGQMNAWYFKSATQNIDKIDINKLNTTLPNSSIHQQYVQSCLASFTNLFAYRRPDIINIFKILPTWVPYVQTTFTAHSHYKVFVNMQAPTPPEFITPYATVNPYSNEQVCLFIDVKELFDYLKTLEQTEGPFENRIAKLVLLAFNRHLDTSTTTTRINEHLADVITGFFPIFDMLTNGKSFATLIHQSSLPDIHHPKITNRTMIGGKEVVKVLTKSDASIQFMIGDIDTKKPFNLSYLNLSVFGIFALKSHNSTDKNPWRLGMIHWAELTDSQVAVDGKVFGRILSACGIRLRASAGDGRTQDFIQAILVSGDGLNQQTSLVMPRYHFKEGDTIILRVDTKESTLRLQKNLLITDDFEQYEVVRLV